MLAAYHCLCAQAPARAYVRAHISVQERYTRGSLVKYTSVHYPGMLLSWLPRLISTRTISYKFCRAAIQSFGDIDSTPTTRRANMFMGIYLASVLVLMGIGAIQG